MYGYLPFDKLWSNSPRRGKVFVTYKHVLGSNIGTSRQIISQQLWDKTRSRPLLFARIRDEAIPTSNLSDVGAVISVYLVTLSKVTDLMPVIAVQGVGYAVSHVAAIPIPKRTTAFHNYLKQARHIYLPSKPESTRQPLEPQPERSAYAKSEFGFGVDAVWWSAYELALDHRYVLTMYTPDYLAGTQEMDSGLSWVGKIRSLELRNDAPDGSDRIIRTVFYYTPFGAVMFGQPWHKGQDVCGESSRGCYWKSIGLWSRWPGSRDTAGLESRGRSKFRRYEDADRA